MLKIEIARWLVLLPALLVLSLAAGCDSENRASGGDGGTGGDVPDAGGRCTEFTPEYCPREYPMEPIPIDRICDVFADAFCRANGNCCEREGEVYGSFDDCIVDQLTRCMDASLGFELTTQVTAGRINYNAAVTGNALARIGPMADRCEPVRFRDAILDAMTGAVEMGEACDFEVECGQHLSCRSLGDEPRCRLRLEEGSACEKHSDCEPIDLQCADGFCEARLASGEPCSVDEECESSTCLEGTCVDYTGDIAYCVRIDTPGQAFER